MTEQQLIADLLSALEYHTEQTRPIEFSKVAIDAAREYLRKPAPAQAETAQGPVNGTLSLEQLLRAAVYWGANCAKGDYNDALEGKIEQWIGFFSGESTPPNVATPLAAQHWHDLYKAKCQELHDERARLGAQIEALENQPAQPKEPLTDEQIVWLVPGLLDCLCDPYDCDKSGDQYASIPKDMVRLARAVEQHHGITKTGE